MVNILSSTEAVQSNLPVDEAEPLKDEMRAFVHCCESGTPALTHIGGGA